MREEHAQWARRVRLSIEARRRGEDPRRGAIGAAECGQVWDDRGEESQDPGGWEAA